MAYFERLDAATFRPTEHVSGGWNPREQHIAPALGLLAHAVETDHATRTPDPLQLARASYDILGTLPLEPVRIDVEVLRPGRTIELVHATLSHAGRPAVVLRAWLLRGYDTAAHAGGALPTIPDPNEIPVWDPADIWPGGFVRSVEVRRHQHEPGRAVSWVRPTMPLVRDESVSATARMLGVIDIANGLTPRTPTDQLVFPNVDLTAHLVATPRGDWIGLDTTVTFGPTGLGLTHTTVHDTTLGPVAVATQALTVRRRAETPAVRAGGSLLP
ncbi:thioesterase family protein [Cellulomonas sp. 179-A 4D5 NHS]|uniref:thioesterase family protein n=1 Tax=Cellulomonas sp. 179-A 4D5 NHS TaxID=3142378 RepID=UPI0039A11AF7